VLTILLLKKFIVKISVKKCGPSRTLVCSKVRPTHVATLAVPLPLSVSICPLISAILFFCCIVPVVCVQPWWHQMSFHALVNQSLAIDVWQGVRPVWGEPVASNMDRYRDSRKIIKIIVGFFSDKCNKTKYICFVKIAYKMQTLPKKMGELYSFLSGLRFFWKNKKNVL